MFEILNHCPPSLMHNNQTTESELWLTYLHEKYILEIGLLSGK